jgi:hypothetical protein
VAEVLDNIKDTISQIQDSLHDMANGFEGGTDDEDDYHCWTCKMNDAPVEDLDLADMLRYIERYHDKPGVATYATYLLSQDPERLSWSGTNIVKWYEQARDASNPSQWDKAEEV